MPNYKFNALLQSEGWLSPAYVRTDNKGKIISLASQPDEGIQHENVNGFALPGFQNAHSHAFQYAMAGIAEKHKAETDDFWSWRETMYKIALTLDPDQLEKVATMLYAEMARHGYTHVAEFHYLHHDKKGKPYANVAEMGQRLIQAAKNAGIKITLVPMFYQTGGFGMSPQPHQRRFISKTISEYTLLFEKIKEATKNYSGANYGAGIHSLRAATPNDIITVLEQLEENIPIHIHIAEQLKEIADAKAFLGARPVEWLLKNANVNSNYHLVHATHLTDNEVEGIANSGAHVVLCPTTEGNLGDGLFPLQNYQKVGGKWSIGTDSHISINPLEELRLLDYGQRLTTHSRNIYQGEGNLGGGAYAFRQSLLSGRKAMNNLQTTYFEVGHALDAVIYDADY
ncbi:MAG: formimidoylglutamate deiminase, partial [Cyclobacteriaceae bacterium]|nr:formimidoylglutamate deiminase [Cyclobacteriaceae bacterium]